MRHFLSALLLIVTTLSASAITWLELRGRTGDDMGMRLTEYGEWRDGAKQTVNSLDSVGSAAAEYLVVFADEDNPNVSVEWRGPGEGVRKYTGRFDREKLALTPKKGTSGGPQWLRIVGWEPGGKSNRTVLLTVDDTDTYRQFRVGRHKSGDKVEDFFDSVFDW